MFDTETWKRTDVLGNDTESKKFMDVDVQYDPERNVIMIELYGTQDDVEAVRVLEYELETGKLIVIE